ncbi:MAG: hypothetical protein WCB27_23075 [Thermoguttaceae bacterium]
MRTDAEDNDENVTGNENLPEDGAMRQCPKCGGEMAESQETCGVCGTPIDNVEPTRRPAEVPIMATLVEEPSEPQPPVAERGPWGAPFGLKPSQPAVGVPRRFGVGTMMILVTAFAMLLGVLKSAGVDPLIFAAVAAFIAGVGACQVLMFKGQDPRRASFYGGIITFSVLAVVVALVVGHLYGAKYAIRCAFLLGVLTFVAGGPLGYGAGCLVAAIFLVRKEPDDAEPPAEEPAEERP